MGYLENLQKAKANYPNCGEPWSPEDVELLKKRFEEGAQMSELVEEFQRTPNGIKQQLKRMGFEYRSESIRKARETYPNAFAPWTEEDEQSLVDMYTRREKLQTICDTLGRSVTSVASRLLKLDL